MEGNPTPYMEANAILRAQENDNQGVLDILKGMHYREIDQLREAAILLDKLCEFAILYHLGRD